MTGDETNKQFNPFTQIGPMKDPVASNTGKPYSHKPGFACVAADMKITELECEALEWSKQKWTDERKIASLESQIATINKVFGDGDREGFMKRYADLESSLEGMKKRNEDQAKQIAGLVQKNTGQRQELKNFARYKVMLDMKLKTAEDKLAGK